ncbi:MYND-type domain-containing protein [Mycena venus]|uniref:MYND-type domain-containing protein n=1 Tax=Mycena venus TaxID=2733690 RepID=A0A8H7CP48_9AGAR|nr:MYND-type domain-containing protein [Mycena venus]
MHDSLHVRNVTKLPSPFRSIALAASKGSVQDLEKMSMALTYPLLRDQPSACWLLPVFYIHLDPSIIPTPDAVDAMVASAARLPCIDAACVALKALGNFVEMPVFPLDASPDLWLRIWPWMRFLHTYWEHIPKFDAKAEMAACMSNCFLVARLRAHPKTRDLTSAQTGLRFIFSRTWTAILLDEGVVERSEVFLHSGRLLPTLTDGLELPGHFEEIVDGAGGSRERMVSAIVKHLSLAVADPKNKVTLGTLTTTIAFLGTQPSKNEQWVSLLLSKGIVAPVVSALRVFESTATPDAMESALRGIDSSVRGSIKSADMWFGSTTACFNLLSTYMTAAPGYPWIAQAIKAGLLHSLISFATQGSRYATYIKLFIDLLPLNLVSHAVVTQMKHALKEVQEISRRRKFMESPSFKDWEKVVSLANERIAVLDSWEAAGRVSFAACDNMQCGKIQRKGQFKRCAGCWSADYCSSDCQSIDWRGGHREVCDELRAERLRYPEIVHPRERSFMRALMQHDYQRLLFDIASREVLFMRDHPGEEYIVVLDYTKPGGVRYKIDPKRALQGHADFVVELPVKWGRLARSGGRMGMHIMYLSEGNEGRPRLFPLRATSADFHEGLATIAKTNPFRPDTADEEWHDEQAVRALMEKTQYRLIQIH